MRVLLVTNDFPPRVGGIERYLSDLVDRLGEEIRVLAPAAPGSEPRSEVVRGPRGYLWPTSRVRRWILENVVAFGPDVVVYGAPWPVAVLAPGIARRTGVPYAVLVYGADLTVPIALPLMRRFVARPLRSASAVLALSHFTERRAAQVTDRPVVYLGCGVDRDRFPGYGPDRSGDRLVIGCVGRFVERKGHHRVISAAEELRARGWPVEVLLVGKGPGEERLRRMAERSEVPIRLEVEAPWDRLPELYRQMDVFVMPVRSRWWGLEVEGLGIVYLEAAAAGLPVVTGPSGGAPETVEPGLTGFVAHDHRQLVEALDLLFVEDDLARKMGEEGRARVERAFTWEQVSERFTAGLELAIRNGVVTPGE